MSLIQLTVSCYVIMSHDQWSALYSCIHLIREVIFVCVRVKIFVQIMFPLQLQPSLPAGRAWKEATGLLAAHEERTAGDGAETTQITLVGCARCGLSARAQNSHRQYTARGQQGE